MKERLHNQSNSEEINLLEEIRPEDRKYVLDMYRVFKENTINHLNC